MASANWASIAINALTDKRVSGWKESRRDAAPTCRAHSAQALALRAGPRAKGFEEMTNLNRLAL